MLVFVFSCRGFGFVTFTDAASVDKVLAQQHHELDSKTVSSFWFFCISVYFLVAAAVVVVVYIVQSGPRHNCVTFRRPRACWGNTS